MKKTRYSGLPLLFALVLWLPSAALALQIVYPADKTFVDKSNYLIVKGGENPPLDGMTVEINGTKSDLIMIADPEYKAAFGDFLILQPQFDPGRNRVVVEGYVGTEKAGAAEAEIFYRADDHTDPPAGFEPFVMHIPQREALCAGCHEMNPTPAQLASPNPRTNPCASCHARMLDQAYVHGPAGVYRCTFCHQPDSAPARYRDRGGDADLCNECHLDKVKEFKANAYVHGPVAVGLCSACHDPHASDVRGQLIGPTNEICLGCHDAVQSDNHVVRGVGGKGHPLSGVIDPSNPEREMSCVSCHDPHGGKATAYFQRGQTSRFALCQICHQK